MKKSAGISKRRILIYEVKHGVVRKNGNECTASDDKNVDI